DVAYCYEFFIELFLCKILWDFRDKYKKLYKLLDSSVAGSKKMIKVMELNSISSIRKFERLTRTMADMVTDLNKIFGWPLAFIILRAVLQLLSTAIHILIDAQMKNFHETKHLLISKLALTGLMIVCSVLTILCCDMMSEEGDKLIPLCYKLQEKLDDHSSLRTELRRLAKYISHNLPKMSAAGFFYINRSTILNMVATVTTYYIVVIQFNLIN
ncbi:unnamed protein product, partial [Tenebrio molitor]